MRPAKLFLIALALVLVIGGVVAATRTKLLPVSGAPTQHGLANQPSASGVPTDASGNPPAASLADLTAQASQGSGFDGTPFALIPPDSSPVAPDFILTTLDGKTVKLSDAVKKGPVLLDFWAIWCGPCRMEMPELGAVYSKYKSRGFQVYGINSDATVPQIKRFFTSGNPGYTMLADSSAIVYHSYGISAIPACFLIDQTGHVRAAVVGFDPNTQIDLPQSLDQLFAGRPQKTL